MTISEDTLYLFYEIIDVIISGLTNGSVYALMAVGLMMLPAVSARLWHDALPAQLINASVQAVLASAGGLLLSYHWDTPSGPTIIGCAGLLYFASLLIAPGGWLPRLRAT